YRGHPGGAIGMTQSGGERDRLGRLAGVVVGVPDPAATAAFLRDGLRFEVAASSDGGWSVGCVGDYGPRGQTAIVLKPADGLELREITWEVSNDYDLAALGERLRAAGIDSEHADGTL